MAFLWYAFRVPPVVPCLLALLAAPFSSKICWLFSKSAPGPRWRTHFSIKHQAFCIKNLTFLMPVYAPYNNDFYHFWSLLWLHCSFASLFVRSRPPSKNACGASPVHISPPRPRLHKRLHASHPQFSEFRVLFAYFFVPAVLYTHAFCNFPIFFVSLLPAVTIAFVIFLAEVLPDLQSPIVHRLPFCSSCICVPN